jgi:hypothetical protein
MNCRGPVPAEGNNFVCSYIKEKKGLKQKEKQNRKQEGERETAFSRI